jgi:hypothetical protein
MPEPPCIEVVHWRVLSNPIVVAPSQLRVLHYLLRNRIDPDTCEYDTSAYIQSPEAKEVKVNRPLQKVSAGHLLVYCECADWKPKGDKDSVFCDLPLEERGVFYFAGNQTEVTTNLTSVGSNLTSVGSNLTSVEWNLTSVESNLTSVGSNLTLAASNLTSANLTSVGANPIYTGANLTSMGTNLPSIGTNMTYNQTSSGANLGASLTSGSNLTVAGQTNTSSLSIEQPPT